jgi:copper transporter 1
LITQASINLPRPNAGFISTTWRIKSSGMFAGSCIGVILLVVVLEALRRVSREYDAYSLRSHVRSLATTAPAMMGDSDSDHPSNKDPLVQAIPAQNTQRSFKPSLLQQLVRAGLHMCTFAVAYFVMLLAMYFNGYIIVCILIGAFLGAFIFSWQSVAMP